MVTSTALLSLAVTALASTPASASTSASGVSDAAAAPKPSASPAGTSTVGGDRLGLPGPQAGLAAGVSALPKDVTARSWIVADAESGDVLASYNAHAKLAPASTLKMLFADTLLPKFLSSKTHKVAPEDLAGMGSGSSLVGIKENETYTVHDLWLGVFLRSGNDAVHVLSAMNGGVKQTVADMNAHAKELQANDTHVVTPDGYDAERQVSSAYDLTLFARSGLQKKDFREYCSTVRAKFPGGTEKVKGKKGRTVRKSFEIQNTNRLLSGDYDMPVYKGIAGVKNGNTTNAGATFTGVAERGGHVLLVTVMKPKNTEHNAVYKEAARLLDWGFAAEGKATPVGRLVPPLSADKAAPRATPSGQAGGKQAGGGAAQANASANTDSGSGGMWTALGITGGVLVLLAGAAYLVNRRWPLPELVRRRR